MTCLLALACLVGPIAGCERLRGLLPGPENPPAAEMTTATASGAIAAPAAIPAGPAGSARSVVERAIAQSGGMANWRQLEGLELEMDWITYESGREVRNPGRVQMATTEAPRIRVHYTKLDQVFAAGDMGPWVMMRGKPDDNRDFIARAQFTAAMMRLFLALPFNLAERGVVLQKVEPVTWAGTDFDAVTVGFTPAAAYPFPRDTLTLWFNRTNGLLDRCFFVSTGEGSAFEGPPPHYLWIRWQDWRPVSGAPIAHRWEFFRSDAERNVLEKLFDVQVNSAAANRSFLPVLFRRPNVPSPVVKRVPVPAKRRPGAPAPKPAKPEEEEEGGPLIVPVE